MTLERFYKDGNGSLHKMKNVVDFELKENFGRFATAFEGRLNCFSDYNLDGICNHFTEYDSDSLESGHYTASCYSEVDRKWHEFNDENVSEIKNVKKLEAYILFYSAKK